MIDSLYEELEGLVEDETDYDCGICGGMITFKHDESVDQVVAHLQNHRSIFHDE